MKIHPEQINANNKFHGEKKISFRRLSKDSLKHVMNLLQAKQKLNFIDNEVEKKLKSEIALLNPEVRSQRLKPLEGQVTQLQQKVKSLNVDYKLNVMNDLEKEANELEDKANENKDDMTKVDSDIKKTTMEMKEIADGLKSRMSNRDIEVNLFCDNCLSQ